MKIFRRKQNRLKDFRYQGQFVYSVTICTNEDKCVLSKKEVFDELLKILKEASRQLNFSIWAYCFMPDHLHLIAMGENDKANLTGFVKLFKQKSGFWFKRNFGEILWQKSFYDHVLRNENKLRDVCVYVLNNPVRAELVKYYLDYPYSGSLVFDIKNF